MSIITRPLTYDDLCQMPEDGNRYELIGGELIVSPSPITIHQALSMALTLVVAPFVKARKLGRVFAAPLDVQISEHDVVEPDLIFVSNERLHIIKERKIEGPPALLVEILSPSSRTRDQVRKAQLYAEAGVPEYWLADPDARTLAIYMLAGTRYQLVPRDGAIVRLIVLPGLEIDVEALFADL